MPRLAILLVCLLAAVVGCQGGPPTFLGYKLGADALYDTDIKTVRVPVFTNRTLQTTPYRGMEVELTKAVVREIGAKTPYRIVADGERADTELLGNLSGLSKIRLNVNQQNLLREGELVVTVDVLWRDLRTGRILSAPRLGRGGANPLADVPAFDPDLPPPPPANPDGTAAVTTRLVAVGRVLPELGESSSTAEQRAAKAMAVQIVSMMEKPW